MINLIVFNIGMSILAVIFLYYGSKPNSDRKQPRTKRRNDDD